MQLTSLNLFQFLLLFLRPPSKHRDSRHRFQKIITIVGRLRLAVGLVVVSILIGTLGYVWIEGFTWWEAWYMSLITMSTVGFGEVHPLSHEGRIFTSFLILFNVSMFAYAISSIVSLFAEGSFLTILNEFNMQKKIDALSGHVIICGFGRHANEVTKELQKQRMDFVIIENTITKMDALRESEYLFVEGDATQDNILEEAGIQRAMAIVTTLPDDADNLFIVLTARQIKPDIRIIARANSMADEIKMRRAGADATVVPEQIGGFYMATLINKPDLVEFFSLLSNMGPSNVVFEEISVGDMLPQFWNKSIAESNFNSLARVSLVALRNPDGHYELTPLQDTILRQDWHLVLLGNPEQVHIFKGKVLQTAFPENQKS